MSGLSSYNIQYKDGAAGTWTDWITQTVSTSGIFTGTVGRTYYFQARGGDLAGNVESYPGENGDAGTEITSPTSAVAALSPYQNSTAFAVYWLGSDASGNRSYDVQYKNGASGTWTDWITGTTAISDTFTGQDGHTYYFQSGARDIPGNLEVYPGGNGDAGTTVDTTLPSGSI